MPKLEPNQSYSSRIEVFELNLIFLSIKNVDNKSNCQILKPVARILPKLKPNEVFVEIIYEIKLQVN